MFEVPGLPSNSNVNTPWLTPQVLFSVDLIDVIRLSAVVETLNQKYYNRVANIEIQILFIQDSLLLTTLDRLFNAIKQSIDNDLNPENASNTRPLAIGTAPTDNPQMQFSVQTNNTISNKKLVSIFCAISNLKADFVDETFARLKTYIVDATTTDLVP